MSRCEMFEVSVAAYELGSLVDAVHEAARRAGTREGPKWRCGNVIGIVRPRLRDLDTGTARRRYGDFGRVLVALSVAAERGVTVHVVFVLAAGRAKAGFTGAGADGGAAAREASLAGYLATATRAVLVADGIACR